MDVTSLLIMIASGAAGGTCAGAALPRVSLGLLGNVLAGCVGGGLGGQILERAMGLAPVAASTLDPGTIATQIAGGGAGGGILMLLVGVIKRTFAR